MGGVQWHTLARKYEERHAAKLELSELGYNTALGAATTLLWDVLRLVDKEDEDNPVVAVEDAVAMVPRPGSLGTWPSLYQTLCNIVLNHGSTAQHTAPLEGESGQPGGKSLLLSQLKPLLQLHWHSNFDERGLGYLSDEGTFIRFKKMKHLVQAVLRWREQRIAWRASASPKVKAVDEALVPMLELIASQKHNDLVLRIVEAGPKQQVTTALARHAATWEATIADAEPAASDGLAGCHPAADGYMALGLGEATVPHAVAEPGCLSIEWELAMLRAENAELRSKNELLLQSSEARLEGLEHQCCPVQPMYETPFKQLAASPQLSPEVFDDPFEPPPEIRSHSAYWMHMASPAGSTHVPSDFGMHSGSATPASGGATYAPCFNMRSGATTPASMSLASSFEAVQSGAATPVLAAVPGNPGKMCTLVPVWFPTANFTLLQTSFLGDRCVIPSGIVQQARALFEPAGQRQ